MEPAACDDLAELLAWVQELRENGVTQVALGTFSATITPPPPPPPVRDEGQDMEQRELETLSSL